MKGDVSSSATHKPRSHVGHHLYEKVYTDYHVPIKVTFVSARFVTIHVQLPKVKAPQNVKSIKVMVNTMIAILFQRIYRLFQMMILVGGHNNISFWNNNIIVCLDVCNLFRKICAIKCSVPFKILVLV